jgi:hypothetical protein
MRRIREGNEEKIKINPVNQLITKSAGFMI